MNILQVHAFGTVAPVNRPLRPEPATHGRDVQRSPAASPHPSGFAALWRHFFT